MPSITLSTGLSGLPVGQYDECLSIRSPEEKDKPIIRGQYCALGMSDLLPPKDSYTPGEPIDDYLFALINSRLNSSKGLQINPMAKKHFTSDKKLNIKPQIIEEFLEIIDYIKAFNIRLPTGFCLPTTCDPKDVEFAVNKCKLNFFLNQI